MSKGKVSRWANFDKKNEKKQNKNEEGFSVATHTNAESLNDIIISDQCPYFFDYCGQYLLISDKNNEKNNYFVLQASKKHKNDNLENKSTQPISILRHIAEIFQFEMDVGFKLNVRIEKLKEPKNFELSLVEIDVKDQFISRRDQQNLNQNLQETAVYTSKILFFQGLKLTVALLLTNKGKGDEEVIHTGIVTKNTTIVYRSLSTRLTFLIEVSKEALDVDMLGEIYYEKIQRFLRVFFQKNLYIQTNHQYTIVLFARLFYPQFKNINDLYKKLLEIGIKSHCFTFAYQIDKNGVIYQDVYRLIKIKKSWNSWEKNTAFILKILLNFIKVLNWKIKAPKLLEKITILEEKNDLLYREYQESQFVNKKEDLELRHKSSSKNLSDKSNEKHPRMYKKEKSKNLEDQKYQIEPECELSSSSNTNILEAINLIVEDYKKSYLGRSLVLSGQSIIVITCGDAQYYAEKDLVKLCKHNLLLNNIFCNVISFNKQPLFQTPCFVYDKSKILCRGFVKSKNNIYEHLIYNCLEINWRELNMLYQEPLKVLEGIACKNYEGIYFDDARIDKSNLILKSNEEIAKIFQAELKCNHKEHYIIDPDSKQLSLQENNNKNITEKNPFYPFSPYWLKANFLTDDYFQSLFQLNDNLYSISAKFKLNEKSFQPISSLGKILRNSDINLRNISNNITYNPLEKKMNELLKNDKNQSEEDDFNFINKKFQIYDKEIFQFSKNSSKTTPNDEHKGLYLEKSSTLKKLSKPSLLIPMEKLTQIVSFEKNNTSDEKKEDISESSLKNQSLTKTNLAENKICTFQLDFNLFEVKNYDRTKFSTNENASQNENHMHKNTSQNDFLKNSLAISTTYRIPLHNEDFNKQKIYSHFRDRWKNFKLESKIHSIIPQYLRKKLKMESHAKEDHKIESIWKDLLIPGLAPLSTPFFPKEKNLTTLLNYSLNPSQGKLIDFLEEVIAQRLANNFQMVEEESLDYYGEKTKIPNNNNTYRMSFGNIHHKIIKDDLKVEFVLLEKAKKTNNSKKSQEQSDPINLPIMYKYLVFDERVGHFTRNSYFLKNIKVVDWKSFDDYSFGYIDESMENMKKFEPKIIKLRLISNDQILIPKKLSHEKIRENFELFFKKLEERMQKNMFSKMNITFLEKRKEIQGKYTDENLNYSHLYENMRFSASNFQKDMTEKDHFFFEYQKFCCPKVTYHMNLYWLSCSCAIINDFIKQLTATAKLCSFHIFYFPYNAPHYQSKSPFETVITLRINPNTNKFLKKSIDRDPFNFVYDPEKEIKRFLHKKALVFLEFENDRLHWRENHHNADGEEGILYADTLFENLNKYILVLDILSDVLEVSLPK